MLTERILACQERKILILTGLDISIAVRPLSACAIRAMSGSRRINSM
jgi:hypothetical protein